MAFLECNDLIKIYTDKESKLRVPALRGVELKANEGDLVSIIGSSGSGKSTLINLIGGIDRPSSGEIILDEINITNLNDRELTKYRRSRIGFLYQLPERNLIWNLSALKNVIVPMRISGRWNYSTQKKRANELLREVGLAQRKNHKPHQLSGGEAQRVGIAIALANDPAVVLADEPTGELDSATTFKIIDYFKQLNIKFGKTFIVVTHDHRFANMTSKAMKMMDGRITGIHRTINPQKSYVDQDEVVFVDDHGNLRIPLSVRKETGIKNHVQVGVRNGIATLIPIEEDDLN